MNEVRCTGVGYMYKMGANSWDVGLFFVYRLSGLFNYYAKKLVVMGL